MSSHTAGPFGFDCANAALPQASTALATPACKSLLRVTAMDLSSPQDDPGIVTDKLWNVSGLRRALDAAQHGGGEVLALPPARVQDPGDVQSREDDHSVAEHLVDFLDPLGAPEAIRDGEPAGERGERGGGGGGNEQSRARGGGGEVRRG